MRVSNAGNTIKRIITTVMIVTITITFVLSGCLIPENNDWKEISNIQVPAGINPSDNYLTEIIDFTGGDLKIVSTGKGKYGFCLGDICCRQYCPSEYIFNGEDSYSFNIEILYTETECIFIIYQRWL